MANDNNKINVLVSQTDDDVTARYADHGRVQQTATYDGAELEADAKTFDVDKFANGRLPEGESVTNLKATLQSRAETINQLQFDIEQLRAKWNGLSKELEAREEIAVNLRGDADKEVEFFRHQIAEQSGLIASNSNEIREALEQIKRTEKYADSLRLQLQDQTTTNKEAVGMQRRLETALAESRGHVRDLGEQVAREMQVSQELARTINELKEQFADETRKIRFELGSAQDTIASQDSLTEQLASDLVDNREFRQALESQLGEKELENEKQIRQLMLRLGNARQEADDYERKMHSKDNAIAALMSELTKLGKPGAGDDKTLHKIDGSRPYNNDESSGGSRARVARMLVGSAGSGGDTRELRFPLFKDRLTIGRTENNDIQLNVRYISRRHAVIATDKGQTRLIDWGSKNGVFVNDQRISEKFLSSGDIVRIGESEFRYEERAKR